MNLHNENIELELNGLDWERMEEVLQEQYWLLCQGVRLPKQYQPGYMQALHWQLSQLAYESIACGIKKKEECKIQLDS
ncbi:MAG: hypothetical protein FWE40_04865 [Oscillospiraceae bacterium]|nr:hypothetical protein [Oscillospiraceae bacterium]